MGVKLGKRFNWKEHPEIIKRMLELRKSGMIFEDVASELREEFEIEVSRSSVRHAYNLYKDENIYQLQTEISEQVDEDINKPVEYKATHEILSDGTHRSDRLIWMSEEEQKDPVFLLQAHGFDPDEWELVSARNNIWHVYSKQDGQRVSYASKITVKPKQEQLSFEDFVEQVKNFQPVDIQVGPIRKLEDKRLLEVTMFDMHFGVSDYEYYKPTQEKVAEHIQSRHWEEILFAIGSDLFHNDDFRGRTASGREIQEVDIEQAWKDAMHFYIPLIKLSVKNSNNVKITFIKGNHDESMSWAFVQMLKAKFPTLEFDDEFVERKIHVFHNVFIGLTHGDKGKKKLHNIFPAEFPIEWANATCREIHTGHFHREDAEDHFGTIVRTLATRNKTDKWHKDNGYVGSNKRFMLFEYSEENLESIHYV